jgi:hypothetical protein
MQGWRIVEELMCCPSVASVPAPGGIMAAVAAECYRCAAATVAITTVVASQAFVRQDHPAQEWEVASYLDPCPWREG